VTKTDQDADISTLSEAQDGFTDEAELLKSFDQFVEEQSCDDYENLLTNFEAFERVIEKAYQNNASCLTAFLQKFAVNFKNPNQSSRLARFTKEASDQAAKQKKIWHDLKTLLKPAMFMQAYPKLLNEIERRIIFNKCMAADATTMNKAIAAEVSERKKFLKAYGDEIPETFIP